MLEPRCEVKGMVGGKKSSQRLEGVDVKERLDALLTEISRVGGSC